MVLAKPTVAMDLVQQAFQELRDIQDKMQQLDEVLYNKSTELETVVDQELANLDRRKADEQAELAEAKAKADKDKEDAQAKAEKEKEEAQAKALRNLEKLENDTDRIKELRAVAKGVHVQMKSRKKSAKSTPSSADSKLARAFDRAHCKFRLLLISLLSAL